MASNNAGRLTAFRHRHAYLLASLLLMIIVRPFFADGILGGSLISILLFVMLFATATVITTNRIQMVTMGIMAALTILFQILWLNGHEFTWGVSFIICALLFFAFSIIIIVRQLFRPGVRITFDTISGAMSVYLLFGLLWSLAFAVLEFVSPGSFVFGSVSADSAMPFDRFLGFSFATLTTLGYGNISPMTPRADALSTLEAITGQIYLVIVVARLVALQIMHEDQTP